MHRNACIIGCLLSGALVAQTEDGLRSKIADVRYPVLAERTRVQGDVRLRIRDGVVTLVAGHPLFGPLAIESAKSILGQANLDVTYHFFIVDTAHAEDEWVTVKRGNAVQRAVLRVFGLKTERAVLTSRCVSGAAPPSEIKVDRSVAEVWVYSRTFCLQTSTDVVERTQSPRTPVARGMTIDHAGHAPRA